MNKEWEDIIDRYLRHELLGKEKVRFHEALSSDPEFAEQVKLSQHIAMSVERLNEQKALEEMLNLSAVHIERRNVKHKTPFRRKAIWAFPVVATVILLLYIGFSPKYSSRQLFEQYYAALPYEEIPSRGDFVFSNEQLKVLTEAFSLYEREDYLQASAAFDEAVKDIPVQSIPEQVSFCAAVCRVETKDIDGALHQLIYLADHGVLFAYDAKWYLALVYLHKGERGKAKGQLEHLLKEENLYRDRASELWSELIQRNWF